MKGKIFFCLSFFCVVFSANAKCLRGDFLLEKGFEQEAFKEYETCADRQNDAEAQYILGSWFAKGREGVLQKDLNKALFYLRVSAENGYAKAQVYLAELLVSLQTNHQTDLISKHEALMRSLEKEALSPSQREEALKQIEEGMLPFTWVLLALDKPENKWFLPVGENSDEKAFALYQKMGKQISLEEKQKSLRQASSWKRSKLLKAARQILSPIEYGEFVSTLTLSSTRKGDKELEIQKLKNKIKAYLNNG